MIWVTHEIPAIVERVSSNSQPGVGAGGAAQPPGQRPSGAYMVVASWLPVFAVFWTIGEGESTASNAPSRFIFY